MWECRRLSTHGNLDRSNPALAQCSWETISGLIAVALLVYLVYAMVRPERFRSASGCERLTPGEQPGARRATPIVMRHARESGWCRLWSDSLVDALLAPLGAPIPPG